MSKGEKTYREMTEMTNTLYDLQGKLTQVLSQLNAPENAELKKKAGELLAEMKAFDEAMAQRLSKAYDDVENFENGFTAHYLTVINEMNGSIVKITDGARKRVSELNSEWELHKKKGSDILQNKVPAMNKALFDSGFGVLYAKK
jgi:hypothetical protein